MTEVTSLEAETSHGCNIISLAFCVNRLQTLYGSGFAGYKAWSVLLGKWLGFGDFCHVSVT